MGLAERQWGVFLDKVVLFRMDEMRVGVVVPLPVAFLQLSILIYMWQIIPFNFEFSYVSSAILISACFSLPSISPNCPSRADIFWLSSASASTACASN